MKKLISALMIAFGLNATAQVIPNLDYQTSLIGPDGIPAEGFPSVIDQVNSFVYIAGYKFSNTTQRDYILIKYDLNGVVQWQQNYDFASLNDRARAVTVDNAGNIYVTGESQNASGNYDIATLKYNAAGTLIWVKRFNGTATNADDKGTSIAVDNSSNVYICGYATNSGTAGKDFTVVKYNSTGVQQFVYTKNGSAVNSSDVANVIVSFGNKLYITGNVQNTGSNTDAYTTRLNDNNGFVNWSKTENGTASLNDQGLDIVVQGNDVLVCGGITNTGTNQDYLFAKYNASNGATQFTKTYDANSGNDFATDLVIDASNTYAMVGVAQIGSNYEYHTTKYNSSGSFSWVNKYAINTNSINIAPKITVDAIANHFYVSGLAFNYANSTLDGVLYQITPGGNKTWQQFYNGVSSLRDANVDLAIDNLGRIYCASVNEFAVNSYQITLLRYSQQPVVFPPDTLTEPANSGCLYYPNKGQILNVGGTLNTDVSFIMMDATPITYIKPTGVNYKLISTKPTPGSTDTVQGISINFDGANPLAQTFPFQPFGGGVNIFDSLLPSPVLGIQGYKRVFIPNVWNKIHTTYYSNTSGMKLYYILMPGADAEDLVWDIIGATTSTINGTSLEIRGFNDTIIYEKPTFMQIDASFNVITKTGGGWSSIGTNTFAILTPTYNPNLPLIIELDYGKIASPANNGWGNMDYCSFYGSSRDDGFRKLRINNTIGITAMLGTTAGGSATTAFPTMGNVISSTVCSSCGFEYMTLVLFNSLNQRIAANIYGTGGTDFSGLDLTVDNQGAVTVIGNATGSGGGLLTPNSVYLTPGTYSNTAGPGFAIQFIWEPLNNNISRVKWQTRLNGYGLGIAQKPTSQEIYITSATNPTVYTVDTKTVTNALNISSVSNKWHYQVSKFDKYGVRSWATLFPAPNASVTSSTNHLFDNTCSAGTESFDRYNKCKVDCDDYGFVLAGEVGESGLIKCNKYYAPRVDTTYGGSGKMDGFAARFDSRDSLVFASHVGADDPDGFLEVEINDKDQFVCIGYSSSIDVSKTCYRPNSTMYMDSIMLTITATKALITKFDTTGARIWSSYYGDNTNNKNIRAWAITSDKYKNVYISGTAVSTFTTVITNPTGVLNLTAARGNTDSYILGIRRENQVIWNTHFAGAQYDAGLGLAYDKNQNFLYFAGVSNSSANGGSNKMPSSLPNTCTVTCGVWYTPLNTAYDGYIGYFDLSSYFVGIHEFFNDNAIGSENVILYPNPSNGITSLAIGQGISGKSKIQIYNSLGQLIYTEQKYIQENTVISLPTQTLNTGVYFVNLSNDNIFVTKKLILNK